MNLFNLFTKSKKADATSKELSFILAVIAVLNFFYFGRFSFLLIPWIHPFFLLIYFDSYSKKRWFFAAWLTLSATTIVSSWGMLPLPAPISVVFLILITLISMIPYLLHRNILKQIVSNLPEAWSDVVCILFLPVVATTFEFVQGLISPSGTWGSVAYSQYSFIYLTQIVSVTGLSGVTFIVLLFSSTIYHFLKSTNKRHFFKTAGLSFTILFTAVILYGVIHIVSANLMQSGKNTKVSSLSVSNLSIMEEAYRVKTGESIKLSETLSQADPILEKVNASFAEFIEKPKVKRYAPVREAMENIFKEALILSREEIDRGADIILWSEGQLIIPKYLEKQYVKKLSEFAKENKIYLFIPTGVMKEMKIKMGSIYFENKVIIFNPEGKVIYEYHKSKPVSGVEGSAPGDGIIPVIKTEFGNFGVIICYDADFPPLLRQAGLKDIDVLLNPSGDWKAISPYHSHMAVFRSIENGISQVRQVSRGLSFAAGPAGNLIQSMDYFTTERKVMRSEIPLKQIETVYSRIGDFFGWILTGLCAVLLVMGIFFKKDFARFRNYMKSLFVFP